MSGNSIGYVEPLSFSSLTSLQTLDISSNQLIFFPKLPNMTSLKSVDISHNKLQSIEYQAFDDFEKSKVFKTLYVYYRIMFLLFRYEFYDCDIYMKILKCSHFICVWHTCIYHCLNTEHLQCWCLYLSLLIHFWVHCWVCTPYRKLDENLALGCDCYLYETLLVVQKTISGGQCGTPASVLGVLFGYVNKTSPMYFENQQLTKFLCCEWFYYYQYM